MEQATYHEHNPTRGKSVSDYYPLLIVIGTAFLASLAITAPLGFEARSLMHYFMGLFLLVLSLFKFFDREGFANGFEMYDLAAKRWRDYALLYPFLELALALAYLSFFAPLLTYLFTLALMGFSALGVALALRKGLDIYCPCMGSILKVPLSTVSLAEDVAMGVMALMLITML